jgi:hypothetical protein
LAVNLMVASAALVPQKCGMSAPPSRPRASKTPSVTSHCIP